MINGISFFILSGFATYMAIIGIRNILISKNKISHPMYDNDLKRKKLLKKGIFGLIMGVICGLPFYYMSIMIIFIELKK